MLNTYKTEYRKILKLGTPVILSQIGVFSVQIFDNAMVGSLGALPLAAVSFSASVFLVMFLGIGLCIMFFPTLVLGTINAVMSPVVQGSHAILESQIENVDALQKQRDDLEYEARVREGKEWLVNDEVYEEKFSELGIRQIGTMVSMWWEHTWYNVKAWFRQLVADFFELLYNAAGLTIDTLRTFFLVVLAILGPLSFALSIYDGFQSTLTNWIARYISVYLWLPVADIFSAVLSKIRALMLESDILMLQDPTYIPDGSNGVYIIFLIIGIIGYFSVPTVAEWIIQSGGGASGAISGINRAGAFGMGVAGGMAGNAVGKVFRRGSKGSKGSGGGSGSGSGSPSGENLATQSGGGSSGGYGSS